MSLREAVETAVAGREIPAELLEGAFDEIMSGTASDVLIAALLVALHTKGETVGEIVAAGLDRAAALRALTQEPADLLGLGDRVGSLEAGKDANMIFVKGDPFEPGAKVEAVMIDGKFAYGEVDL